MIPSADLLDHLFRRRNAHQKAFSLHAGGEKASEENGNSLEIVNLSLNTFPAPTVSATVAVNAVCGNILTGTSIGRPVYSTADLLENLNRPASEPVRTYMVAERHSMIILFAYSLVRKLAVSVASRPNRVRKLKKICSARRSPSPPTSSSSSSTHGRISKQVLII